LKRHGLLYFFPFDPQTKLYSLVQGLPQESTGSSLHPNIPGYSPPPPLLRTLPLERRMDPHSQGSSVSELESDEDEDDESDEDEDDESDEDEDDVSVSVSESSVSDVSVSVSASA